MTAPHLPLPPSVAAVSGGAAGQGEPANWSYALVGPPNTGKSSIFNALTGLRQRVGNYAGVTVERREGELFGQHGQRLRIVDLPGCLSLVPKSPDEAVARDVLLGVRGDTPAPARVLAVADAGNLPRSLFFVSQLLELGLPTIVVLNMVDEAQKRGLKIDVAELSKRLGVPVVSFAGHTGQGRIPLVLAMSRAHLPVSGLQVTLPPKVEAARTAVAALLPTAGARAEARALLLLLGQDESLLPKTGAGAPPWMAALGQAVAEQRAELDRSAPGWREAVAAARHEWARQTAAAVTSKETSAGRDLTAQLDRVVLHPIAGWAVLGITLWALFYSIFTLAATPMEWIDAGTAAVAAAVEGAMPAGDLRDLLTQGILAGVGGVLIFLPQILLLFLFLGVLEGSGYLARAAFLLDKVMSVAGLQGRSFIPMLGGYACAVPALMATRAIESPRERLATILVLPLQSCSARLPVYLVMLATLAGGAMAPEAKATALAGLYALGTAVAFAVAWLLRKTLLKGASVGAVSELPPYRWPTWRWLGLELWDRARVFVVRAGTIILGLSILLWALAAYPKVDEAAVAAAHPTATEEEMGALVSQAQIEGSFAGQLGQAMQPLFAPLGYDWKITVGVLASFAAREVFVSTLAILYAAEDTGDEVGEGTLVETLRQQRHADGRPLFDAATCLSLLVFYVFALQCVSTLAIARRETNSWRWPAFMFAYMLVLAYGGAWLAFHAVGWLGWA